MQALIKAPVDKRGPFLCGFANMLLTKFSVDALIAGGHPVIASGEPR